MAIETLAASITFEQSLTNSASAGSSTTTGASGAIDLISLAIVAAVSGDRAPITMRSGRTKDSTARDATRNSGTLTN